MQVVAADFLRGRARLFTSAGVPLPRAEDNGDRIEIRGGTAPAPPAPGKTPEGPPAEATAAAGSAAAASAAASLATGPGAAPAPPGPPTPTAPTALRQAFDRLVNVGGPGTATLLEDNAAAWNARWRLVESARHTVTSQYFCWDHDVFGMALMGHLYKKAKNENVKMRLMVDATGDTYGTRGFKSHIGGKDYLQELVMTGNVEARVYHPHWKKLIDQALALGSTAIAASNHDKILEVDGERGITGGRNIGYEYYVHPDDFKGAWRDTDFYFEGREAAHALRSAFDVEYGAPWITSKVRGDWFGNWVQRDLELVGAYALMDAWLKDPPMDQASKDKLRGSEEERARLVESMVQNAVSRLPAEGIDRAPNKRELKSLNKLAGELVRYPELRGTYNAPAQPAHQAEIKILDKTSSVGIGTDQINAALMDFARTAQKRIVIENPYVVLTDTLLEGLKEAGKRGVEIWLGTNSPSSTDSDVTQAFFLEDWPKVMATVPNLHLFVAGGERKLHAKVAVMDDVVSLVTTYNMDLISQQINSEVAGVIWSESFAKQTYDGILRDHADPRNKVVEYKILRDAAGQPIRSDGLPVLDAKGDLANPPEVVFGPDDHVSKELMEEYRAKRRKWGWLRRHIPQLRPLEPIEKQQARKAKKAAKATP